MTSNVLLDTTTLTGRGVTPQIEEFLPAAMQELHWAIFSSGWDEKPHGTSTYALPQQGVKVTLHFNATNVFVVDPHTGYDQQGDRWWRTDIYTAPLLPEVQDWIVSQLPDWWDWKFACKLLITPAPDAQAIDHGREGRFTMRDNVTDTEWSALHLARVWAFHPKTIQWEPEPRLVWSNGQNRFTGRPTSLWTDGKAITQYEFYHPDNSHRGQIELAKAASTLLSIALRRKQWRTDDRWKKLLLISSYETKVLKKSSRGGPGNYGEKRLEQLTLDTGDILYLTVEEGGCLGEDGDAWDYRDLYEDKVAAEAAYKTIKV